MSALEGATIECGCGFERPCKEGVSTCPACQRRSRLTLNPIAIMELPPISLEERVALLEMVAKKNGWTIDYDAVRSQHLTEMGTKA